ncbi:vesicular glutamate transporter 1-like [Rhopalosiphum maidis]|uniref:vesicular glutamate transporter 1-like n=1 Tax=Rhopalosiphum maidis TaxID=43146 RepID=UPI000EFED969|nr:vesicular glutamate transporter 1-like [Rhopalosiphum maidis]
MNFWENETNSSPHSQQSSYRLVDRCIRLKTTYWNREYTIILLAYIGLTIVSCQFNIYYEYFDSLVNQNKVDSNHFAYIDYYEYGYYISLIPAGILVTIYPAHNIFGISFTILSICYLIATTSVCYVDAHVHFFLQFFLGMAMATVIIAIDRVWTYWVPLDKQTIRHVPIVLHEILHEGGYIYYSITELNHIFSSYTLTLSMGLMGLAWYVVWFYVINGNQFRSLNVDVILFGGSNNHRYSFETSGFSLIRSIVSDIPWKSLYTSKPVLVIALLYVCNVQIINRKADGDFFSTEFSEWNMRTWTIIILLLVVILAELFPEIIISTSTTNIRKFWTCLYFGLMSIYFFLESIIGNALETNEILHFVLIEIEFLYTFGFYLNYLDIAPVYASLLFSLLLSMHYISSLFWELVLKTITNFKILDEAGIDMFMAVVCLAMATCYGIFASAEVQPWAADRSVEENQQDIIEDDGIPSV